MFFWNNFLPASTEITELNAASGISLFLMIYSRISGVVNEWSIVRISLDFHTGGPSRQDGNSSIRV